MTEAREVVLSVQNLTRRFGGLVAVAEVSFDVLAGEIVALIGPNGAGKTTLFNVVTGVYQPSEGDVFYLDESLADLQPHEICRRGIARTFQNIRLFNGMTVLENVMIGRHTRTGAGLHDALFGLRRHRHEEKDGRERARHLLEFVGLTGQEATIASDLPYGHQRRLEIARALASEPKLLLLDEPAAGLTPAEKTELKELIEAIRGHGITVLLIEHDMKFVMGISDRVVVLDYGRKIAEGIPEEIRRNPAVIEAYLGTGAETGVA
ncbi:MAG: ABC transporter ATP-binding protein [Candidatus Hydrogenedentota bacterium]|nr:MAG: ABC transporter ATP-binding protein [Candidatus Hydrogenedentota bacterium]